MSYTVTVPCKSYVKKYFTARYGEHIPLDHRDCFGDTILTKMISTPLARANKGVLHFQFKHHNAEIKFKVPTDFFFRIETCLTPQQVYNINRYLENIFESELFLAIIIGHWYNVQQHKAIQSFCDKYKIELDEEISMDAMKKSFQRYKKAASTKSFFLLQMSSPLSSLHLRANVA